VSAVPTAWLEELAWRGLLYQRTAGDELDGHLAQPGRVGYCGFDPTAPSLTHGNLVPLTMLVHLQRAGHVPIALIGGGTGLIGDPSERDAERPLLSREQVEANVEGQRRIFERLLDFDPRRANPARLLDNAEWLCRLGFVEVLRDVGKHFSVNMMIQKDSVRARLEAREHGISYTEFSYMILQAYDFAHLRRSTAVTVQLGGSDQWGNIVAGVELTRRQQGEEVFGLTTPLVTKSDGGKFGKTESGAIWLTRKYTSPYAFYQFWLNAADADVERYLRIFSLRPLGEVEALLEEQRSAPEARAGQRALAEELTRLLHGSAGLADAKRTTDALFSGDVRELSSQLVDEAFAGAPVAELDWGALEGDGLGAAELLVASGAAKSKREAREFLASGAVSVNGERVDEAYRLTQAGLLHGRLALVRRGKKHWSVCRLKA
jgi:tyrosyl-tRNA synthetase